MSSTTAHPVFPSRVEPAAVANALAAAQREVADRLRARAPGTIEVSLPRCDALAWLARMPAGSRRYFRAAESGSELAAIGIAASADRPDHPDLAGGRIFGTIPFEGGCDRFVLPLISLSSGPDGATLCVQASGDPSEALALLGSLRPASDSVPALAREGDGDPLHWAEAVDSALREIEAGRLEKVVLARTRASAADGPVDPMSLLMRMRSPDGIACHMAVESAAGDAFVAASPERLYSRRGGVVCSPAIAGTCPRGMDEASDGRLATRLLASEKDRREHEVVVRSIRNALGSLCTSVRAEEQPGILRLRGLQHLQLKVEGTLREGVTDAAILKALHPTPAVCGTPTDAAMAFIRAHERFPRGLFAGAIGVCSHGEAEFAVGIRGARVRGRRVTAFAGAGIVRGSNADAEWLETERKLDSFDLSGSTAVGL